MCTAYRKFIENWNPSQETENAFYSVWEKSTQVRIIVLYLTVISRNRRRRIRRFRKNIIGCWQNMNRTLHRRNLIPQCAQYWESASRRRGFTIRLNFRGQFFGLRAGRHEGICLRIVWQNAILQQQYFGDCHEKKYTVAFNSLVNEPRHRALINDMVVLYFAIEQNDGAACDLFSQMFGKCLTVRQQKQCGQHFGRGASENQNGRASRL